RAEAHVLRLSLLYALLNESDVIRLPELEAALAFWDYAARSAGYVFGEASGEPARERLLEALRVRGSLTRTEVWALLGRHRGSAAIEQLLMTVEQEGLIRRNKVGTA